MYTNRIDTCGNPIGEVDAGDYPASVSNDLLSSVPSREIIKRAFLKGIKKRGLDDWLNEMVVHWENWEIYKQKVIKILGR